MVMDSLGDESWGNIGDIFFRQFNDKICWFAKPVFIEMPGKSVLCLFRQLLSGKRGGISLIQKLPEYLEPERKKNCPALLLFLHNNFFHCPLFQEISLPVLLEVANDLNITIPVCIIHIERDTIGIVRPIYENT